MVLGDRLHLAFFKKIWWHNSCHAVKHHRYFDEIRATLRELRKIVVSYQMWKSIKDPNFLKKCQMQPISQDQWQISKFILYFKSTYPTDIMFDGISIGWIFSAFFRVDEFYRFYNSNKQSCGMIQQILAILYNILAWCFLLNIEL